MRYLLVPLCALLVILSCAGPGRRAHGPTVPSGIVPFLMQKLPTDRLLRRDTLDNGMRYYVRRNASPAGRLELRLVVRVGSVLEEDAEQGFARLVTRLALRGTERFPARKLQPWLRRNGGDFGAQRRAYCGFDQTVFALSVSTDSLDVVLTGLQILADWAGAIAFREQDIAAARRLALADWERGRSAEARLWVRQVPVLLQGSRYAQRLPRGARAVIDTFHAEDLRRFYHTWYRPDLMAVMAVGDCDPQWLEGRIQACFGTLPGSTAARALPRYPVPAHAAPRFFIASDPEAVDTQVCVYSRTDIRDESTVGAYRQHLVELLYERLLNRRLERTAAQAPYLSADAGRAWLVASLNTRVLRCRVVTGGAREGLAALLRESRRAGSDGFTADELDREKSALLRFIEQAHRDQASTLSQVYTAEYTRNFLRDEPVPGLAYEYGLYTTFMPRIQLAEINALAARVDAQPDRLIIVTLPAVEGTAPLRVADLAAVLKRVRAEPLTPYLDEERDGGQLDAPPSSGTLLSTREIPALGVIQWTLGNGIQVFAKPTDFKADEVLFAASRPGGSSRVAATDYVAVRTAAAIARESGVGRLDAPALKRVLAGRTVQVVPWIAEFQEGFRGGAATQDLETLLQWVRLSIVAPRADSSAFVAHQERLRELIRRRAAAPESAFHDTLTAILSQHHPRARPWSPQMVAAMRLVDCRRVYRELLGDATGLSFYFVGAFEPSVLRDLVVRYLGGLPTSAHTQGWRDTHVRPPAGVVERCIYQGRKERGLVRLVFHGTAIWSPEESLTLQALAAVMRREMRAALAADLDAPGALDVVASMAQFPVGSYRVAVEFGCDPERVDTLSAAVFAQLARLRAQGPDSASVHAVGELLRHHHETDLVDNGYWLELLESCGWHQVDPLRVLRSEGGNATVTVAQVQRAAARYLRREQYVRVILLPADWRDRGGGDAGAP